MSRTTNTKKDYYNQISLDDFSDDDSSDDDDEAYAGAVPNAQRSNGKKNGGGYRDNRNHRQPPPFDAATSSSFSSSTNPQQQQQELLFQQQEQGLELLSQSAERLGTMSMAIGDELTAQNQILDDMDTDLETAAEHLDFVTRKTKEFIQVSGGTKNCILIATLSGIVILLILLILYT